MVFAGLGYLLDQKLNHRYLFTLLGMFLGFGYVMVEAWKFVRNINRSDQPEVKHDADRT